MSKTYSYGPLKSEYFSQYEKMWIEGFCKENKIELTETNVFYNLNTISKGTAPASIKNKITNLIAEAEKFSSYAKGLFEKSWNNILGYSMGIVKPNGTINENQVEAMMKTSKWWLLEAPKIMSEEVRYSYFKGLVLECIGVNGNILEELKTFNPVKKSSLVENAKTHFSYEKITKPCPPCRIPTKDILENEPVLNMIPDSSKVIAMIAWSAETVKLIPTK